jgi:hypothetical protein
VVVWRLEAKKSRQAKADGPSRVDPAELRSSFAIAVASRVMELRTDRHSVAPVDAHLPGRAALNLTGQAGSRSTRSILPRLDTARDWGFTLV